MNKTQIEWCRNPDGSPGYTWNPITGCLNGCEYCYARKLANGRLKSRYQGGTGKEVILPSDAPDTAINNPFYPRFWEDRLTEPCGCLRDELNFYPQKAKGIFTCDMSDLFGIGIPAEWTKQVMEVIQQCSQHRFYLLTKQPQNLIKFSPFPGNCWVGVSATNDNMALQAFLCLKDIKAPIKFLSFEPLLSHITLPIIIKNSYEHINMVSLVDWVIIGACTGTLKELLPLHHKTNLAMIKYGNKWTLQPQIEWVTEIIEAADKAGVAVFLKDNLYPLLRDHPSLKNPISTGRLRQEMPV